jgi:5-methylcytosine-specific restriction enzyme A
MSYHRHSNWVTRSKRWKAVRQLVKRRDGFKCTECGSRHRLEVHHRLSVRTNPELAFALSNLQLLCAGCHTRKTRAELGQSSQYENYPELSQQRRAWRELVKNLC